MAKRTPNEIGESTEKKAAAATGGSRVTQSGGGRFYKLDIRDGMRFIWSCKGTDKDFIRVTASMLREAMRAARGMQGTGDGVRPGIIIEMEDSGELWAMVPLDDLVEAYTGVAEAAITPSKGRQRLQRISASRMGSSG
jgi:hypothetical protein